MTLFSHCVSAGQKRQCNNTVGTAAIHPDDELPTKRRTHEKNKEKSGSPLYARQPTWHQRMGVKLFHTPYSTSFLLCQTYRPTVVSTRFPKNGQTYRRQVVNPW